MKKAIFLCLFVFLTTTLVSGQKISFTNNTLGDKNSRTLYIGIDNKLEIHGESFKGIFPQAGVFLTQNIIKIRPATIGKLTIVFLTKNGEDPIVFNVKRVPDPIPVVAGQPTNEIINRSLLDQSHLTIKSYNDDTFFEHYKVSSFNATVNGSKYEVSGNSFSGELRSAITNLKTDDLIAISDVRVYNEENSTSINIKGDYLFKIK